MTTTAEQIVADVRQLSSLFNNNLFSDTQIVKLFNDGASELYDWMVGQFETWFLTSVDFTLAGGVGGNIFPMPMDKLLKDNTLELNPTTNTPCPIPRLGTWSDRNRGAFGGLYGPSGGRRYYPAGSNLMVFPSGAAAGNYRLWYTPKYIPVAEIQQVPEAVSGTPATINGIVSGTGVYSWVGAAWNTVSSLAVGGQLIVTGAANAANNGTFTIMAILTPTSVQTNNTASVSEGAGATATWQPVNTTDTFNVVMEPWVLYPEIHAAISIRTSRQQDTADLQAKLVQLKQRIETATANRTEEVPQSPLRDYSYRWGPNYFGGG